MAARRVLITGGAGFIGSNLADRMLAAGHDVTIFDNLSRPGSTRNLEWLRQTHGDGAFRFVRAELADGRTLEQAAEGAQWIFHLAGQVAVTTSLKNPRQDFESNALGTFNLLEAARLAGDDPIVVYASTNKVYGSLADIPVVEQETRYAFSQLPFGIPETQPVDFHSPYGCSKGAGDQYARDYARIYGLRSVVLRQSCVYGYRQFGVEDQGWLAWFTIAALKGRPVTIYGTGKQVRDVLFVDDLLDVYERAVQRIETTAGQMYNVGGGPQNTLSVWREFAPRLTRLLGRELAVDHRGARPGDQAVYVSDIRKAERDLQWRPAVSTDVGLERLFRWVRDNLSSFDHL